MIDDTIKPADTAPAAPATNTGTAADTKQKAAKPAATRRTSSTAKAAPARKRPAALLKMAAPSRNVKRPAAADKPAAAKQPARVAKPAASKKADKPVKAKKVKLVRDSFTMPELEYAQIAVLKKRCLDAGISVKKSEILRAAVANLVKLSDTSLLAAVRRLDVIKTGRPAKGSK